jgi:Fe-S-cluster-containing dehydrogenase component
MQYGFVIDHDSCIGCHACTVACKAENDVPVGNFRTSVKYTEVGHYPEIRRHFLVQRCNHCRDAPCVTICPVNALIKRPDGIVDIDRDACIGCRACMQACPYDAIYLNDDLGAVEKCHFCAHRVEQNLAPACVNVCPVNAIIPGDFDDPGSRVSLIVQNNATTVRRPEQGTIPNVHYVGAHEASLQPGTASRPPMYLWSDRPPQKPEQWPPGVPVRDDARTVLDAGHRVEWGWAVALYLVTKGIAGGAAILAPFVGWLRMEGFAAGYLPEIIALVFTIITMALLIEDLKKPWAFYRLLTRPNWKSWLVRGGVVLGAFTATTATILLLRLLKLDAAADALRWANVLGGAAVAGYTAFLFAQCKGRDLWESGLLLPHLLVQAVMCGAVVLNLFVVQHEWVLIIIGISAALHGACAIAERYRTHETDNARQGAGFLGVVRVGPLKGWRDGLLIGVVLTIALTFTLPELAVVPALVGLYLYEHAFVRAGQLPPLS